MIVTRKIQIRLAAVDDADRKQHLHSLYEWRAALTQGANWVVSHKFVQQNIRDFVYIKDEIKEKFYIQNILKEEPGCSEQNVTYRILSERLKGKVPADLYGSMNQEVAKTYKETSLDVAMGKQSLRSYRSDYPLPFSAKNLRHLSWNEDVKDFTFTLFDIPFLTRLGRDRSGNRVVLDRILQGDYKMCSSKIQIDDKRKRLYLLLCVDLPKQQIKLNPDKILYAMLTPETPILTCIGKREPLFMAAHRGCLAIGSQEEFNYRRTQIQAGLHRLQEALKYARGGKGRKRKLQAVDRYHKLEINYVDTRLHTYSRQLIDLAVKHECGRIVLVNQERKEQRAKEAAEEGDTEVLRNWSYFGLKTKIDYKAKLVGITVEEEKIKKDSDLPSSKDLAAAIEKRKSAKAAKDATPAKSGTRKKKGILGEV